MLAAELGGKLPSQVRYVEDVLTSYVFGFLRYASRPVYLRRFLENAIGIRVTNEEAETAEFLYWPTLADGTEPDVVIVVGEHYLLFEAKLFAGFDPGDGTRQPQLKREWAAGRADAGREGKEFHLVAVTADSCQPRERLHDLGGGVRHVRWINWQRIAQLVLGLLEEQGDRLPDNEFARDLLSLLDARHLRGYRGFQEIPVSGIPIPRGRLFLQAETMDYRGDFLGFTASLISAVTPEPPPATVFFSRRFFVGLEQRRRRTRPAERIFYEGG
jgi:hypothetical protein